MNYLLHILEMLAFYFKLPTLLLSIYLAILVILQDSLIVIKV